MKNAATKSKTPKTVAELIERARATNGNIYWERNVPGAGGQPWGWIKISSIDRDGSIWGEPTANGDVLCLGRCY